MWWSVWIVHLPGPRINWKTNFWAYLWGAHLLVSQLTWEHPSWVWVHWKEDPRLHNIERACWEPPRRCGLLSTLRCRLDVTSYCKFLPPWQSLHDTLYLDLWPKINTFSIKLLLLGFFLSQQQEKKGKQVNSTLNYEVGMNLANPKLLLCPTREERGEKNIITAIYLSH